MVKYYKKIFDLRVLLLLCSFFSTMLLLNAQGEKVIISDEVANSGTNACVEISVEGFTNIRTLSLVFGLDPLMGIGTFTGGDNYNLPGFGDANITDLGLFGVTIDWDAADPNVGESVADGTTIFELCYDVSGAGGESVDVILIIGGVQQSFFGKTNGVDVVPMAMDGSISIPDMPLEVTENNIIPDDCFATDNGAIEITVTGGVEPYSFMWSNMSTDEDLTGVQAGNYTVTVSDSAIPSNEVIVNFLIPDRTTPPVAGVGMNGLIDCNNEIIMLGDNTTSTGPEFEYQWTAPGVMFVSGQNEQFAEVNQAAIYTFMVINIETNCTAESMIIVAEDKLEPNVELGDNLTLSCNGQGVLITAENDQGLVNLSSEWSTDVGEFEDEDILSINALSAGTYSITLTNTDNGCTNEDDIMVTDPVLPSIMSDDEMPTLNCDNTTVLLTAITDDLNILVNWTTSNGQIDGATDIEEITAAAAGVYIAEATDPITECKANIEIEVFGNTEEPSVNAGDDLTFTCNNPIVTLNGTAEPGNTIEWTDANGNFVSTELSFDVNRAGMYFLNVTNEFGCLRTDEVEVVADTISPIANAGASFEIGCISEEIALDGTGSEMGDNISYMWSTSNGILVSGFNTLTPTINSAGIYDLVVTNETTGCSNLSSIEVSLQEDLPLADAGVDFSTCENSTSIMGNLANQITGQWTTTSAAVIADPSSADVSVDNLSAGENAFIWTFSTADCADYSRDTVRVTFESAPNAIADIQSIPLNENTISFSVLDNDDTSNNDGVTVTFQATDPNFMDLGNGIFSFTFPTDTSFTFSFSYTVCSEVCPDLCDGTDVTINRLEPALEPVELDGLPNVITPNGDGLNDALVFDIMLTNPEDFPNPELVVFNRWGDVVYKQQPYDNNWQGTNQTGGLLPEGTYYFVNRLSLANNEILKGDITIIRD